jgi:tRNA(Ile)-lysidine synthase
MRGSGLSGLAGIPAERPLEEIALLRPLLAIRKADLVAVCDAAGIAFVEDPSNRNPRFARVRLRALMPALEAEGLDAPRLSRLAARVARAEAALEAHVEAAILALGCEIREGEGMKPLDRAAFLSLPEEIGLRLLGRAVTAAGTEGPVELAKLEALHDWVATFVAEGESGSIHARSTARTLAGAVIRVSPRRISVRPAPPRRSALPVC